MHMATADTPEGTEWVNIIEMAADELDNRGLRATRRDVGKIFKETFTDELAKMPEEWYRSLSYGDEKAISAANDNLIDAISSTGAVAITGSDAITEQFEDFDASKTWVNDARRTFDEVFGPERVQFFTKKVECKANDRELTTAIEEGVESGYEVEDIGGQDGKVCALLSSVARNMR